MGGEANNTITVSQPDSLETGIDDPHNIYSFSYLAKGRMLSIDIPMSR